jgi:hypothetical protein
MDLRESVAYPIGDTRAKGGHKGSPSNINQCQFGWKVSNDSKIGKVVGHIAEQAE